MSSATSPFYKWAFYSLLVLVIAGGISWAVLAGGESKQTQAIQKVLEQSQALERENLSARGGRGLNHQDLTDVAGKMKRLDIHACPADFREAFIRLAGELQIVGQLMKQYPDLTSLAIDAGLNFLAGEKDAGLSGIKEELNAAARALIVRQTELEAIAVRHGARLLHD